MRGPSGGTVRASPSPGRRRLVPAGLYAAVIGVSMLPGGTVSTWVNDVTAVLGHALAYAALAVALAWSERVRTRREALRVLAVLLVAAVVNEALQVLADGRAADPRDVVVDVLGAGGALLAWLRAGWAGGLRRPASASRGRGAG